MLLRRLACVGVLFLLSVGLVVADDFFVSIRKVDGNKISAVKGAKKDVKGEDVTLTAVDNVKVIKGGKKDKETKKFDGGEAVEGGLKNEMFTKIGEKGIGAIVTTNDDGKVTQVRILAGKKKAN